MMDSFYNDKLYLSKKNKIIKINKYIILKNNKKAIIVTDEIYKLLLEGIKKNMNIKQFSEQFQEESKEYILNLLEVLYKNNILTGKYYTVQGNINNTNNKISIMLTDKCNLNCKHCCYSCKKSNNNFIDYNNLIYFLENISKNKTIDEITLSGGEPLMYNKIFDLVIYLKKVFPNLKLILSTNATLITELNVKCIISNFDKVCISFDGYDESSVDFIRGIGTYKKITNAINLLKKEKFNNIEISFTKTEFISEKDINKFKNLADHLNVGFIIRKMSYIGRAKENNKILNNNYMSNRITLMCKDLKVSSLNCNANVNQIFISSKGDIYPCPSLYFDEFKIGSITQKNIRGHIFNENNEYILKHIFDLNYNCSKCNLKTLCWSCPAEMRNIINDYEIKEWCEIRKKQILDYLK